MGRSIPNIICCAIIFFEFALLHHLTLQTDANNWGLSYHLIALNLFFCATCYFWVQRRSVWIIANIIFLLFFQACTLYFYFFKSPLSASTIISQHAEALESYFVSVNLLTNNLTLLYFFTFLLKLFLNFLNKGIYNPRTILRYVFPVVYLLVSIIGWYQIDPMKNIRYWKDFGNLASSHGYFQTWLGEFY